MPVTKTPDNGGNHSSEETRCQQSSQNVAISPSRLNLAALTSISCGVFWEDSVVTSKKLPSASTRDATGAHVTPTRKGHQLKKGVMKWYMTCEEKNGRCTGSRNEMEKNTENQVERLL